MLPLQCAERFVFFVCMLFTAFNLDFYAEVLDLTYLLDHLAADPFFTKFHRLNEKLAEVVQDYSLVSFVPLNVEVLPQFLKLCLLNVPTFEL